MLQGSAKDKVVTRLKRIEGQIGGIRRMIENEQYCVEVLIQLSAATAALAKVGQAVLRGHMEVCVTAAFESGDADVRTQKINELMDVFGRYGRLASK